MCNLAILYINNLFANYSTVRCDHLCWLCTYIHSSCWPRIIYVFTIVCNCLSNTCMYILLLIVGHSLGTRLPADTACPGLSTPDTWYLDRSTRVTLYPGRKHPGYAVFRLQLPVYVVSGAPTLSVKLLCSWWFLYL